VLTVTLRAILTKYAVTMFIFYCFGNTLYMKYVYKFKVLKCLKCITIWKYYTVLTYSADSDAH